MITTIKCVIEDSEYANLETRLDIERLMRKQVPTSAKESLLTWTPVGVFNDQGTETETRYQATLTWKA